MNTTDKVTLLKKIYTKGTRIHLRENAGKIYPVFPPFSGTVIRVMDNCIVRCRMDNGKILGLVPGVDLFSKTWIMSSRHKKEVM